MRKSPLVSLPFYTNSQSPSQFRKGQGFTAVKMNATGHMAWLDSPTALQGAADRIKAVRDQGLDPAIDFHGRVHKPMAKQLATLVAPFLPLFIEEPLLSENIEGIKQIASLTSCPIALGERLFSRWEFRPFFEAGCVDVAQPDVSHVGGISEMRRVAAMAETYDVGLAPHCPLGPIALAACMQVDATSPNFAIQEMSVGIHYNSTGQDIATYIKNPEVWEVKEGHVEVPWGPGLGVEINEELVRELAKDAKAWVSPMFTGPDGELREW